MSRSCLGTTTTTIITKKFGTPPKILERLLKTTSRTPRREQHSVAVDSEGVAYSWGSGGSRWDGAGALGLGDLEDKKFLVPSPTEITALSDVGAKVCEAG